MKRLFEILDCDDKCWVALMFSTSREEIGNGLYMYKIPNETCDEYLIHNKILNKNVMVRTNISWDILNLIEDFKGNLYIKSPIYYKEFKVYNITKMTRKCKLYKTFRILKITFDYIVDTLKLIISRIGIVEIAILTPIVIELLTIGIIWFCSTR